MGKKRIYFKPVLEKQIDRDAEIRKAIREHTGWDYEVAYKKNPGWCTRISRLVGIERTKRMADNVGSFFAYMFAEIFGGEVKRARYGYSGFHADVVEDHDAIIIETEVKATAKRNGAPKLGLCQFANALGEFYRLTQLSIGETNIQYAIFQYGPSEQSLGLAKYDNNGLVKILSRNVRSLLVIPLNFLIPMILTHHFAPLNHGSSTSSRYEEHYSEPHARLITAINKSHDATKELFEFAKKQGFSQEDLCLENLVREETMSPDNLYCRSYRVQPFKIVHYLNRDSRKWANAFVGKNNDGVCHRIFDYFYLSPEFFLAKPEDPKDAGEVPF